jgi:hypothetical protein
LTEGLGVTVSIGNTIPAALTIWALSLKYVCAISSVDMATAWPLALHAVCKLPVVSAGDSAMPSAFLPISIDEPNAGCFGATVHEFIHVSTPMQKYDGHCKKKLE